MRKLLVFLTFVGGILAVMGWLLGHSRQMDQLTLPLDYEDEGL